MEDHRVAEPWLGADGDVAELSNEYELLSELGRGGSAIVYRAVDRTLGRDVAIKVVHPRPSAPGDDPVARLAREARTVAQLQHPSIVTVFAVRRLRSGGLALVMQMVPGSTLKQVIQREGPLAPDRVERLVRDVAQALSYAHARGVVHRDVKPENIFVDDESGRALLADFGIARSDEHDSMTLTGTALGTPFYMSPEQVEGGTLDGRSDLYSLGLVAWEMLTGRRPWDGESLYNVIYKQKHEDLPPIEALRSGVPLRLQYLVERMLQKRPAARWAGADGLLAQLGHAVLPSDYGRWQTALRRRVERYRDSERERARPAEAARGSGNSAATLRFPRRPRQQPGSEGAAGERVPLDAATTAISIGPDGVARAVAPEPDPEWLPAVSERIEAPAPIEHPDPVHYQDVAEPSWAAAGVASAVGRRPALLAVGGLLTLCVVGGGTFAGRVLLGGRAPAARQADAPETPAAATLTADAAAPALSSPATAEGRDSTAGAAGPVTASFPIGRSADVLAAGGSHSCVVTFGANVHCWGANGSGQLGDATDVSRARPVRVAGDFAFTQVSSGASHTCAVTVDGDAYCWGADARGQLGDGTTVRRTAPVRVAGSDRFVLVASGGTSTCAITRRSDVACWGANDHGQLGDGGSAPLRTVPGPVRIGDDGVARAIVVGAAHACALDADSRAFCWGANEAGQLGDGTRTDRAVPVAVAGALRFRAIAAGAQHSCGITTGGQVACWGRNQELQLGAREPGARSLQPSVVPLPGTLTPQLVAVGTAHSCVLGGDGDAWCWGSNGAGQIGAGARSGRSLPARLRAPGPLATISAAAAHGCALTTAGQTLCWGANRDGQVGDSTRTLRPLPTPVHLAPQVVALPLRTR